MMEALQEEKVIGKLKELGYEPGVYVYSMTQPPTSLVGAALLGPLALLFSPPKPFILNFTEKGIAFLELNSACSNYTDMHTFIAADRMAEIAFKKGMLINTLTLKKDGGKKQVIKISNKTVGVSWQTSQAEKLEELIKTYKK
jgi:hypothetical protein